MPTPAMKTSPRGVLEIAEHEGIVLGPYLDSVNVKTWGVGHTASAGPPDPAILPHVDTRQWSSQQVEAELLRILAQFDKDLGIYERRVNKYITAPLKQHQFDALVSFDFNTGGIWHKSKVTGTMRQSNIVTQINMGDMSGKGFMGWVKPPEVVKRRRAEQALFRSGNYDANGNSITLWDALGDGRLRIRGNLASKRLADLMGLAGAEHIPEVIPPKPAPAIVPAPAPVAPPEPPPVVRRDDPATLIAAAQSLLTQARQALDGKA